MWPGGEVAQPRKPPPDLGTDRYRNDQQCRSIHRDARTRDPFPLLAGGPQDVMLHFGAPTGMQCMAAKIAVISITPTIHVCRLPLGSNAEHEASRLCAPGHGLLQSV
jgi:hypothetical protein